MPHLLNRFIPLRLVYSWKGNLLLQRVCEHAALVDTAQKFSKQERLVEWFQGFLPKQMGIQVKTEFLNIEGDHKNYHRAILKYKK